MAIDPRTLDYAALVILVVVVIFFVYLVIYIHDIPYEKAKERHHPHRDAIHVAGWVSLFLMHVIWPFLWIWAYLYKPGEGWGLETIEIKESPELEHDLNEMKEKIAALEAKLESTLENTETVAKKEEEN